MQMLVSNQKNILVRKNLHLANQYEGEQTNKNICK